MNHCYFLAYSATKLHGTACSETYQGYRVFEIPIGTSGKDIVAIMEDKLDSIKYVYGADSVVATAFNKI